MYNFEKFMRRIKIATNIRTTSELATVLEVGQPTISDAKKRNSVPAEWLMKLYRSHNLNPLWLADGLEPFYVKNGSEPFYAKKCMSPEKENAYDKGIKPEIDSDMLARIIEYVEKYLAEKELFRKHSSKAKMITHLYEHFKLANVPADYDAVKNYLKYLIE